VNILEFTIHSSRVAIRLGSLGILLLVQYSLVLAVHVSGRAERDSLTRKWVLQKPKLRTANTF
jgi:hypothetical protein